MNLTDVHTHTAFSPDGTDDIQTMVERAKALHISYYGISEHFDYDYKVNNLTFGGEPPVYTDAEAYFSAARALQHKEKGNTLLVGGEFGITPNRAVVPLYRGIIERYRPDFIVNSVHTSPRADYYFFDLAFAGRGKEETYREYFRLVEESLDADYEYDIVGHLGYCSRYAPYADKKIRLGDFRDEIDRILKKIIDKGKILEINSSAKGAGSDFLPDEDILARYFALGGRDISFASDAHAAARIADKREQAVALLKDIGFTSLSVPCQWKKIKVPL